MELLHTAVKNRLASLASYLAAHVLLCPVPAFFIAGALSALVRVDARGDRCTIKRSRRREVPPSGRLGCTADGPALAGPAD
jgi:uncharacterized membrane protein YraQ (UPF0718 family)